MARPKLLKLVTLDITNTLFKVAGSPGRQYGIVGRMHGVKTDEANLTALFTKFYKQYLRKYPNFGAYEKMSANEWWSYVVKDCFHAVDPSLTEDTLQSISNDLYVHYMKPEAWVFLPGAYEALKDLHRYQIKLGVISNWDHRLYRVLDVMGMQGYFDFVIPSYVVGVEKPDERIFQLALREAQCLPNEAVHFGDSIEKDLKGAMQAGLDAFLLATPGVSHDGLDDRCVVESVQEFVDMIRPRLGRMRVGN
ncbi:haloacid dehalogenase-like hydrolase domain-containing protein 3 [Plakobranchus ocellatus]|uniref:Haloacid dehalogenase-like hydrolase domain-containing protein 3 n=1 Tax=Plakobranchus ocellatus TaxID=259542 RepID=A0AAV3ZW79_9GAST|nr:haloacid dehalogenase-like hydrolase domain-containing protein 3 [Plakobranchus ocellatus]